MFKIDYVRWVGHPTEVSLVFRGQVFIMDFVKRAGHSTEVSLIGALIAVIKTKNTKISRSSISSRTSDNIGTLFHIGVKSLTNFKSKL